MQDLPMPVHLMLVSLPQKKSNYSLTCFTDDNDLKQLRLLACLVRLCHLLCNKVFDFFEVVGIVIIINSAIFELVRLDLVHVDRERLSSRHLKL